MTYEQIQYDVADGILTITLDRPEKLNAFTEKMLRELLDAFDRADTDDAVRAIIVTGAGRAFCAGADLSSGRGTFDYSDDARRDKPTTHRDGGGLLTLRIFQCKKPVIAAINGPAVGVGVTMTLPMDIRLASDSARMGLVFVKRGIVPEACSSWFLPRLVGIAQATEWVYTGRIFDADEAKRGGLVSRVLPGDQLLDTARALAREMSEGSAMSVALSRQMMWRMLGADHPMEAHKVDSRAIYAMGRSADAAEGVNSFLEKRPAKFTLKPSTEMPDFYPWWSPRRFE